METRQLVLKITGDVKDASRSLSKLEKDLEGLQDSISGLTLKSAAFGVAATGIAAATAAIGLSLSSLDRAREIEGLTRGFQNLQEAAGLVADESLQKLRDATQGLISDFDLMQAANQAVQLGLDPKNFDDLSAAAVKLGAAVGRDATEAINDLTVGIGRESKLILDNLGILIKSEDAYQSLADQLGKTTKELTFAEKAIFEVNQKAADLPDVANSAATEWQVLGTTIQNAQDSFAEGVGSSEALQEALAGMGEIVAQIDFSALGEGIANFTGLLIEGANAVTNFVGKLADLPGHYQSVTQSSEAFSGQVAENRAELINNAQTVEELGQVYQKLQAEFTKASELVEQGSYQMADGTRVFTSQAGVAANVIKEDLGKALSFAQATMIAFSAESLVTAENLNSLANAASLLPGALGAAGNIASIFTDTSKEIEKATKETENLCGAVEKTTAKERAAEAEARKFASAQKAAAREAERTAEAAVRLEENWQKTVRSFEETRLQDAIKKATDELDQTSFNELNQQLEDSTFEGLKAGYEKFQKGPEAEALARAQAEREAEIRAQVFDDSAAQEAEVLRQEMEDAYQESVNTWEDLFQNAITGTTFDLEDALTRVAVGFASQLAAAAQQALVGDLLGGSGGFDISSASGIGQQIGQGVLEYLGFGGAAATSTAVSGTAASGSVVVSGSVPAAGTTLFGGAGGGAAAGSVGLGATAAGLGAALYYGYYGSRAAGDLFSGDTRREANGALDTALLSSSTFAWVLPFLDALDVSLNAGKDPDQRGRDAVRSQLEELERFQNYRFDLFTGGQGDIGTETFNVDFGNELAGQAVGLTDAISSALGLTGKLQEDFSGLFANAILGFSEGATEAANFNEVLLNAGSLMDSLGLTAEQGKDALTAAFLDGQLQLGEFGAGIQSFNLLAQDNLIGEGSISDAIDLLAKNFDNPRNQLKALELLWAEAGEIGITSMGDLANAVSDLSPELAEVFRSLEADGITSFENIAETGADRLFAIFNNLEPLRDSMRSIFVDGGQESADSYRNSSDSIIDDNRRISDSFVQVRNSAEDANRSINRANSNRLNSSGDDNQPLGDAG